MTRVKVRKRAIVIPKVLKLAKKYKPPKRIERPSIYILGQAFKMKFVIATKASSEL